MAKEKLPWGTVKIIGGRFKGRIGYYDDDEWDDNDQDCAVILGTRSTHEVIILSEMIISLQLQPKI